MTADKKEEVKEIASEGRSSQKPEHAIVVDPETAYFNSGGGTSFHMLVNTSERKMALKIRSSNNDLYRVSPTAMIIEGGECQQITITRQAGPARADKLVIQFIECGPDDKDAKEFFTKLPKDAKPVTLRINLKMADQKNKKYTSWESLE